MRLFIAITPGPEVLSRLSANIDALREHAPSAKWIRPGGLHLTLAFLGERAPEDAPAIAEALAGAARLHAPFVLRLRGGGAFGRPARPRVLWAGCEGDVDALRALHADIAGALAPVDYVPDRAELTAHLTLCRAREQGGDRELGACVERLRDVDFGETRIDQVELYESQLGPGGARYTLVSAAPLSAG